MLICVYFKGAIEVSLAHSVNVGPGCTSATTPMSWSRACDTLHRRFQRLAFHDGRQCVHRLDANRVCGFISGLGDAWFCDFWVREPCTRAILSLSSTSSLVATRRILNEVSSAPSQEVLTLVPVVHAWQGTCRSLFFLQAATCADHR